MNGEHDTQWQEELCRIGLNDFRHWHADVAYAFTNVEPMLQSTRPFQHEQRGVHINEEDRDVHEDAQVQELATRHWARSFNSGLWYVIISLRSNKLVVCEVKDLLFHFLSFFLFFRKDTHHLYFSGSDQIDASAFKLFSFLSHWNCHFFEFG